MNQGKYVFSQVVEFLPVRLFDKFVATLRLSKSNHGFKERFRQTFAQNHTKHDKIEQNRTPIPHTNTAHQYRTLIFKVN
jgi:hypothetical protein